MAAGKASLLSFLCGLVSFIFLYFTPVSCGPILQPVDLPKKFGEAKEFWQKNKCVFPTLKDYEADVLASLGRKPSFPLKACSAVDPTSENLNFTLVLCSTFFEVSRAFCKSSLESKQYLVQTSELVDDPEWQVCDAAVELKRFNVTVFSFMTKDTSVCEHQCVDNRNLSPVCRLLIAAAVRYEEDYNKKRLQGTSIRGHEEKAQDVEKKTQLVTVTDDEENISQGQHSALTLPPVAPSQEPSSMAPPQGSNAAEPAKENTTAVPVKGNGATKQQEENNEAPSEESSSTLAPQKSATVAPSNENSSTAPPHGISTAVPAKENIAAEPPKPNSAMEPPEVIVTAVPSNGSSSGALPQENNSTSPQEIDIAGLPQANSTATSTEENPATMSPQRNTTAELSEGEGKPTPSAGAVESSSAETERFQTVSSSSTKIYDSVAGQGETGRNETGQNETGQDKTTSVEIQSPLPSGSSAVEQESDFTIDTEYEKETTSSGSFMAYFITAVVLCVAGYVVYHNRQKILAFIMEGRQEQHRRRSATGGGSTAKYSKLHSSAEEAMPSLDKSVTSRNYIY